MITEKSCGAIVFTKDNGCIQYVIIRSKEGFYGFPKGHMEENETEAETALREVAEEVGLSVTLIPDFRTEDTHTFNRNGETRLKHIVYFLGEYSAQTPIAQETELNGVSREASGAPCLNPRRGLTLLSPVCRDPAIGV